MDDPRALIPVAVTVVNIVLLVWVMQDAKKRGASPVGWGIAVFFLGVIGWIFYLLARPPLAALPSFRL